MASPYSVLSKRFPFEITYSNDELKLALVTFLNDKYNEFFDSLEGVIVTKLQEKPFTLQDYFMSFYKEERDFGGLSGVKGNSKEGLAGDKNGK